jgi:hypothetical protein
MQSINLAEAKGHLILISVYMPGTPYSDHTTVLSSISRQPLNKKPPPKLSGGG